MRDAEHNTKDADQDAGAHVREELENVERRTHDGIPAAPQGDGAGDELARTNTKKTTNPEVGEVGA